MLKYEEIRIEPILITELMFEGYEPYFPPMPNFDGYLMLLPEINPKIECKQGMITGYVSED